MGIFGDTPDLPRGATPSEAGIGGEPETPPLEKDLR